MKMQSKLDLSIIGLNLFLDGVRCYWKDALLFQDWTELFGPSFG